MPKTPARLALVCGRCTYARQIGERVPARRTYYCPECNRDGSIVALAEAEVSILAV